MSGACSEQKNAALRGALDPAHLAECPVCAKEQAELDAWRALADEDSPAPPSPARREEIRAAVLAHPTPGVGARSSAWPWAAAVGALFLAGALAMGRGETQPTAVDAPVQRAQVTSSRGARYVHSPARAGRPETVRLSDGQLELVLQPFAAQAPVLIATDDAELQIVSCSCEIEAVRDRLTSIRVLGGMVELRRPGEAPMHLGQGASWHRAEPAEVAARPRETSAAPTDVPPPAPEPEAPPSPLPRAKPHARVASPPAPAAPTPADEQAFQAGWTALKDGRAAQAIEQFRRVEQANAGSPLAEDASYGLGVALERAQRGEEAVAQLERFLGRYPESHRREEVAASLGWLLLGRGQAAQARRYFDEAKESAVPRVRASARRGLDALNPPAP